MPTPLNPDAVSAPNPTLPPAGPPGFTWWEMTSLIVFTIFFMICTIVGIHSRPIDDFINYTVQISFVICLILIAVGIVILIVDWSNLSFPDVVTTPLAAVAIVPFYGAILYGFWVGLKESYFWFRDYLSDNPSVWALALAAIALLMFGGALFVLRLRYRSAYGLTESLVGVAIGIHKTSHTPVESMVTSTDFAIAILTASIYLIVRGFDNIHTGITKDPRDPIAAFAIRRLRITRPPVVS